VGTPFVAISYEHKTEGIAKQLGMESNVVNCKNVDAKQLASLLVSSSRNLEAMRKNLRIKVATIRTEERKQLQLVLSGE
jgi:polysaccharide pyruvyl transferase WcaK-like protein